jgi:lipoprotein NlpD
LGVSLLFAGCASQEPAPIQQGASVVPPPTRNLASKRPSAPGDDKPPAVYRVVAGDTLYGIAWRFGLDARDIGRWNHIDDFNRILVGQKLKLQSESSAAATISPGVVVAKIAPMLAPGAPRQLAPLPEIKPLPPSPLAPKSEPAAPEVEADAMPPKVATPQSPPPALKSDNLAPEPALAPAAVTAQSGDDTARLAGGIAWRWPASGKRRTTVAATGAAGLDILGARDQPVYAAAEGQVVYSGNGLRGYGQLIIIKHSDVFLSAYAHNDKLLVGEGSKVKSGQQIAAMGDSEADEVMLHFEIRKGGKAVEPLQFLPGR